MRTTLTRISLPFVIFVLRNLMYFAFPVIKIYNSVTAILFDILNIQLLFSSIKSTILRKQNCANFSLDAPKAASSINKIASAPKVRSSMTRRGENPLLRDQTHTQKLSSLPPRRLRARISGVAVLAGRFPRRAYGGAFEIEPCLRPRSDKSRSTSHGANASCRVVVL